MGTSRSHSKTLAEQSTEQNKLQVVSLVKL